MSVCIPCLLDLAVTEAAGDLLYIDSLVDEQRGVCVAEIVDADIAGQMGEKA